MTVPVAEKNTAPVRKQGTRQTTHKPAKTQRLSSTPPYAASTQASQNTTPTRQTKIQTGWQLYRGRFYDSKRRKPSFLQKLARQRFLTPPCPGGRPNARTQNSRTRQTAGPSKRPSFGQRPATRREAQSSEEAEIPSAFPSTQPG